MTTTDKGWQYVPGTRIRHVKRGSTYTIVGPVGIQAPGHCPLTDEETVVLYRGDDGKFWARRAGEIGDGRFELVAAPKPEPSADLVKRARDWWAEQEAVTLANIPALMAAFAQEHAAAEKARADRLEGELGRWRERAGRAGDERQKWFAFAMEQRYRAKEAEARMGTAEKALARMAAGKEVRRDDGTTEVVDLEPGEAAEIAEQALIAIRFGKEDRDAVSART